MKPTTALIKLVTQHELFRGFTDETVELIIEQSNVRQLQPEEVLIELGKPNDMLYLLIDGELRVILEKDDTQVSIPIRPGEFLGEISLVEGGPASAQAICHTESRVLAISETVFWQHLGASQQGVKNLMNMMAQRLHRNNEALIKEIEAQLKYQQLQHDLETAGKIQANIVPDGSSLFPKRTELEVYAMTKQARAVGGDFFDALALDQDHIYIAIGDATGKGMPAALFMMRTFTSLRFLVSNYPVFSDVMPALNNSLAKQNEDMMFVSLWVGILNVKTGVLHHVNGGHHPALASLGGSAFEWLPMPNGPIVGVVEDAYFEVSTLKMQPGDTLFLYSDGLPEAYNPQRVAFETTDLKQHLNSLPPAGVKELVQGMETRVAAFVDGAPAHDDLTMLGVRYLG